MKAKDFILKSKKEQVEYLRNMWLGEINKLIKELKLYLYSLKFKNSIRALKQTHFIPFTKKSIARAKTILKEKILSKIK